MSSNLRTSSPPDETGSDENSWIGYETASENDSPSTSRSTFTHRKYRSGFVDTSGGGIDGEAVDKAEVPYFNSTALQLECRGFSSSLPLKSVSTKFPSPRGVSVDDSQSTSERLAWTKPQYSLPGSSLETELFVVHSSEYSFDGRGRNRVTLVCPGTPQDGVTDTSAVVMRWLHIRRSSLSLDILQKFILHSPFVSDDSKTVAIRLLDDVAKRFTRRIEDRTFVEPGSVLRYIGTYPPDSEGRPVETDPIVFLSTPYLTLQNKSPSPESPTDTHPLSLLHHFYGYDSRMAFGTKQVVRDMNIGNGNDLIHVSQLWCVVIGADILVTFSPQRADDIRGDDIKVDPRSSRSMEPLTVCLTDDLNRRFNIVIERDCSFIDFVRQAVAHLDSNSIQAVEYDILNEDGEILLPIRWVQLLASGAKELGLFHVSSKKGPNRLYHRPMEPVSTSSDPPPFYNRGKDSPRRAYPRRGSIERPILGYGISPVVGTYRPESAFRGSKFPNEPEDDYTIRPRRKGHYPLGTPGSVVNQETSLAVREEGPEPRNTTLRQFANVAINEGQRPVAMDYFNDKDSSASGEPSTSFAFPAGRDPPQEIQVDENALSLLPPLAQRNPNPRISQPQEHGNAHALDNTDAVDLSTVSVQNPERSMIAKPEVKRNYALHSEELRGHLDMRTLYPLGAGRLARHSDRPRDLGRNRDNQFQVTLPHAAWKHIKTEPRPIYVGTGPGRLPALKGLDTNGNLVEDTSGAPKIKIMSLDDDIELAMPHDMSNLNDSDGESSGGNSNINIPFPRSRQRSTLKTVHFERTRGSSSSKNKNNMESPVTDSPGQGKNELPIYRTPFFAWRLGKDAADHTVEGVDATIIKILAKVNNLLEAGSHRKIYLGLFKCSLDHLILRSGLNLPTVERTELPISSRMDPKNKESDDQSQAASHRPGSPATCSNPISNISAKDDKNKEIDMEMTQNPGGPKIYRKATVEDEAPGIVTPEDQEKIFRTDPGSNLPSRSVISSERHLTVMRELLEVSKLLFWEFVPEKREGTLLLNACVRFWGSLDMIFRCINWSVAHEPFGSLSPYTIRNFDQSAIIAETPSLSPSKAKPNKPWSTCTWCTNCVQYETENDALSHLHEEHFNCDAKTTASDRPYDDPCYAWIDRVPQEGSTFTQSNEVLRRTEEFIQELHNIRRNVSELHMLVGRVGGTSNDTIASTSPLPLSIVLAFGELVALFSLASKHLSLLNHLHTLGPYPHQRNDRFSLVLRKLSEVDIRRGNTQNSVVRHLFEAWKDIFLLCTTAHTVEGLETKAVGAEFVALSVVCNLQSRPLLSNPQATNIEYIYRDYANRLRFQANRRPGRHLFRAIHALEEEIDAVAQITTIQIHLIYRFLELLYPGSRRIMNTTRMGVFPIEEKLGLGYTRSLDARQDELNMLKDKAGIMKEHVRQMIDILEENHGKAIRVFTFVTLFFLPLSFVSSFMGMNTTDVRDTSWDQKLFWICAVPVTTAVIVLALVYGYKGDEITDWFASWTARGAPWSRRSGRPPPYSPYSWGPGPGGDTSKMATDSTDTAYTRKSFLGMMRQRKREGQIPRRSTSDSLGV